MRDAGKQASDAAALVLTAGLAAILLTRDPSSWISRPREVPNSEGIELSVEEAAAPAAPTPPPVLPHPVRLQHKTAPVAPVEVPPIMSVPDQPLPDDSALVAPAAPAASEAPARSHADIDAQYAALLHADIDHRTHPPDSAQYRLRHPAGEARVRFVVTRSGVTESAALVRSSGSALLDEAAVAIVASGHYPPMPAPAFAGEAEHTFFVSIEFRPATAIVGSR